MRVEVIPGTETPPGPVEEVLARLVGVDVPPVVVGVVLGPVRVDQALHIHHGVRQRVVHLLPEDHPAPHGVGEGGHGRDEVGVLLLDVGADPAGGYWGLVYHHTPTHHTLGPKQTKGGVHKGASHLLPAGEVSELA